MSDYIKNKNDFLELSSMLTDFDVFSLNGTGQVDAYWNEVNLIAGEKNVLKLLHVFNKISHNSKMTEEEFLKSVRKEILSNILYGPIVRNIIKLWYTGMWYQLPLNWSQKFGETENDMNHFINSASYMEGLLWNAIDAPPAGAKGPGFGSWHSRPRINFDNSWKFKKS